MELISIVKDCWNRFGQTARVGALTAGILVGGLVSSLYAQEEIDAFKPKDFGKYGQVDLKAKEKAEQRRKEKEVREKREREAENERERKAESRPDKSSGFSMSKSVRTSGSSYNSRRSGKIKLLSFLEYAAKTSNIERSTVDHRGSIYLQGINFKDSYVNAGLHFISERKKNDGFEFMIEGEGYDTFRGEKLDVTFSIDSFRLGYHEQGGLLGLAFESKHLDLFFGIGGRHRRDVTEGTYTEEGDIFEVPRFSLGTRIGNESGVEIKGDIMRMAIDYVINDLPWGSPPPDTYDWELEWDGNQIVAEASLFHDPEGENAFFRLWASYANTQLDNKHAPYGPDGTLLGSITRSSFIDEEYCLSAYFFGATESDNKKDFIIEAEAQCDWNKRAGRFMFHLGAGFRSPDSALTKYWIEKNKTMFEARRMIATKNTQNLLYNSKKDFHYDVGLSVWVEHPQADYNDILDRKAFVGLQANMVQPTDIGNLGIFIEGWINTLEADHNTYYNHEGYLRVQASLFGRHSLSLTYTMNFNDVNKLSATEGGSHTLELSMGLGF